jgi:hypothetical protein
MSNTHATISHFRSLPMLKAETLLERERVALLDIAKERLHTCEARHDGARAAHWRTIVRKLSGVGATVTISRERV